MKRLALVCLAGAAAFFVACQDDQLLTSPEPLPPEGLSLTISDGAPGHGGNPHFFFLLEISDPRRRDFNGESNPKLDPAVLICPGTDTETVPPCTSLDDVRVHGGDDDDDDEGDDDDDDDGDENGHYSVEWSTEGVAVGMYRIRVLVGGVLLGFADVELSSDDADDDDDEDEDEGEQNDVVRVEQGETLPIEFRIEVGAVSGCEGDCAEESVGPDGGLVTLTVQTSLGPKPIAFAEFPAGWSPGDVPRVVTIACNTAEHAAEITGPGEGPLGTTRDQWPLFCDYDVFPPLALGEKFLVDVRIGMCQVDDNLQGPFHGFVRENLVLGKGTTPATFQLLPFASTVDVLSDCRGVTTVVASSGIGHSNRVYAALDALAGRLKPLAARLFAPRPLHAGAALGDGGVGGLVDIFSTVGAVEAIEGGCEGDCTEEFVEPAGETVLVTNAQGKTVAFAEFPTGWSPGGVPRVVTIECNTEAHREAIAGIPGQGPLATDRPQWPLFCDYELFPPLEPDEVFDELVTVGVCQVDNLLQPSFHPFVDHKDLFLGKGTTEETFQLLPRVSSFGELGNCTGATVIVSNGPGRFNLAHAGWRALTERVAPLAVRLFAPRPLHAAAAATAVVGDGGVGGLVDIFSTFGAVEDEALPGLVSWWPAENNYFDIVGGNDGTAVGGVAFVSGIPDRAFGFDGVDDFVNVPDNEQLNFGTNDFTVGFWVNFRSIALEQEQVMVEKWIQKGGEAGESRGWTYTKIDDVRIRFAISDTEHGEFPIDFFPGIATDCWSHVAATRAGDTYTMFWNGPPIFSDTPNQTYNLSSTSSLKFGHRGNPQDTPGSVDTRGFYLDGLIDEVEIFNRALDGAEIQAIYDAAGASKCDPPVPEATSIEIDAGNNQTGTVGTALPTDPSVLVTDQFGNPFGGANVTFAVTGGGGSVNPGVEPTNLSGIAATEWTLGTTAGANNNTLRATVAGVGFVDFTASATAGTATQLAFTVQPSNTTAGAVITPAVEVTIQDAFGNTVTGATDVVSMAIAANPGGGTLSGTSPVSAVSGVATFSDLSIDLAGVGYTLGATSPALTGATSAAFDITAGAPTQMVFTVQPSNTTAGAVITPAVEVTIQDAFGNTVTGATDVVSMAIAANPGGGTLSGTSSVAAVAGVATFSDLSIDLAATGYTLTATSGSLTPATSAAFDINFDDGFETLSGWTPTGLWNRSTLTTSPTPIFNAAYPTYVDLASGDVSGGALPSPFGGTWVFWYGDPTPSVPTTGNFMGTQVGGDAAGSGGTSTGFVGNSGTLTSPNITLPTNGQTALLKFDTWFEIESVDPDAFDIMLVSVEDVGLPGTTELGVLNPGSAPLTGAAATPLTSGGFDIAPVWFEVTHNLDAFKGKTIRLIFEFDTGDELYNGFRGWIIDNVRITMETPPPMAPASLLQGSPQSGTLNPARPKRSRQ